MTLACDTERFCFLTRQYKGCFIHTHSMRVRGGDISEVVTWNPLGYGTQMVKSYRAAQLAITKYLKEKECENRTD